MTFPDASGNGTELRSAHKFGWSIVLSIPTIWADEVSRQSWQLITAIHDEWFMMV
jgi:hypothetical protein